MSFELTSFDDKLIAFNLAWGNFYRNHFGCPPHAQYLNECFPNKTAMVDYGEFQKVVKQWEKQFAEMQKNVQTGGK